MPSINVMQYVCNKIIKKKKHLECQEVISTYLMSPLAPSAIESTLLPSIRIYAKEPRNPAPKLNTWKDSWNCYEERIILTLLQSHIIRYSMTKWTILYGIVALALSWKLTNSGLTTSMFKRNFGDLSKWWKQNKVLDTKISRTNNLELRQK